MQHDEPQLQSAIRALQPQGIGGWLYVLAVIILLNVSNQIAGIIEAAPYTMGGSGLLLLHGCLLGGFLVSAALFIKKHRAFPVFFVILMFANTVSIPLFIGKPAPYLLGQLFQGFFWTVYLLLSRRVQNTFLYDSKGRMDFVPPEAYRTVALEYLGATPLPQEPEARLQSVAAQLTPKGIGGWLILVIADIIIDFGGKLYTAIFGLDAQFLGALTVSAVFLAFCLVLLFKKHRYFAYCCIASLALNCVIAFFIPRVDAFALAIQFLGSLCLVAYLLTSERVQNTFVYDFNRCAVRVPQAAYRIYAELALGKLPPAEK